MCDVCGQKRARPVSKIHHKAFSKTARIHVDNGLSLGHLLTT